MAGTSYVKPSEIRFSQDSIAGRFQKGGFLNTAISDIKNGSLRPEDFPSIRVIHYNGGLYSLDNRRLYVFRVCEYNGWITRIPVIMAPPWKLNLERFTTNNQGVTIDVRQGGTMKHYKESWLSITDNTRRRNRPPTPLSDDETYHQASPIVSPNTFHLPSPNTKQTSSVPALSTRTSMAPRQAAIFNSYVLSDDEDDEERLSAFHALLTRTGMTPRQAAIFNSKVLSDDSDDEELLSEQTSTSAPQQHRSLSDHSQEYFSSITRDTPASAPRLEEPRVVHRQKTGLLQRFFNFCCCCCIDSE